MLDLSISVKLFGYQRPGLFACNGISSFYELQVDVISMNRVDFICLESE